MFLIIYKVLDVGFFHGNNKAIAHTWPQNGGWANLNAYNTTYKVQIRTISLTSTLNHR